MFNQIFAYGMELIPFNECFLGKKMIDHLEFM